MRIFFYFLGLLLVLAIGGAGCLAIYAWDYYDAPGPAAAQTTIIFNKGVGFQGISDELAKNNVIDNPLLFKGVAAVLGSGRRFQAGEYSFPAKITPHKVMAMIADGKVVVHKVVFPEGLNVREITNILAAEPGLEGEVPQDLTEGSLMPETYHFTLGEKRSSIIARMQAAMKTTLETAWAKRSPAMPLQTMEQALTLASIVEKETGLPAERGHVASVFFNRLKLGMKLQSDPTVVYGLEHANGGAALGRSLTTADLQMPTPYNTYTIAALPPAPIANPGRASIEAVMNPPYSEDLYFVATGSGGHNFAGSLEEHNHNVALYRAKMAKQ